MDPSTERALARLRDPDHPAATELAELVARQLRDLPLTTWIDPARLGVAWADALRRLAAHEDLSGWLQQRVDEVLATSEADPVPLRDRIPPGVPDLVEASLGAPFTASEAFLFRLMNQPALNALVGHVLDDALKAVGRRLHGTPEAPTALRGLLRSVRDNLGGVAGQIVDVVKEEVDGVLESRVSEAVASVTERAVRTMARYLADPAHAEAFADMRRSVAEELLATPVTELAAEVRGDALQIAITDTVAALRTLAARADLDALSTSEIERGLSETGDRLGPWLDELGLVVAWDDVGLAIAEPAVRAVVATDAFGEFWARLHA